MTLFHNKPCHAFEYLSVLTYSTSTAAFGVNTCTRGRLPILAPHAFLTSRVRCRFFFSSRSLSSSPSYSFFVFFLFFFSSASNLPFFSVPSTFFLLPLRLRFSSLSFLPHPSHTRLASRQSHQRRNTRSARRLNRVPQIARIQRLEKTTRTHDSNPRP